MITIKQLIPFAFGACLLFTIACKKDKTAKMGVPELTTSEVTNILSATAISGGNIISNGGETIVVSGICWSKTNNNPTISDDTTKSTVASGSFTAMLKNLSSSSTYYVRAYATNRMGTGYGNVITFNTGNGAPIATVVSISGDAKADALLTGNYTYSDPEGDAEAGTIFQWYTANDATGTGEAVIAGANEKTFRIADAQQGKYIRVGVTPKAATGSQSGIEVKSAFVGAVGEATTVTFMYNGSEVTYGIINSASGRKWLDRNLGATRVATAIDDYLAFGDMFQWGRAADGHQRVTRTDNTNGGATGVNGVTSLVAPFETSSTDVPTTNKFIANGDFVTRDWRTTQKDNLWLGVNGINNPCPAGWRMPTQAEWIAENFDTPENAFALMKLTRSGRREAENGTFVHSGLLGFYWSSTPDVEQRRSYTLTVGSSSISVGEYTSNPRAVALACRCIKDN